MSHDNILTIMSIIPRDDIKVSVMACVLEMPDPKRFFMNAV
jgi:hypothetical protein